MIRKNRLQCWALLAKNGTLVGRHNNDWFWYEAYKTLTFRTRKAALLYTAGWCPPMPCKPVKICIETYVED